MATDSTSPSAGSGTWTPTAITARYRGTCQLCTNPIRPGQRIYPSPNGALHVRCPR